MWAIAERNIVYSANKGESWDAKELSFASAGNLKLHRLSETRFATWDDFLDWLKP